MRYQAPKMESVKSVSDPGRKGTEYFSTIDPRDSQVLMLLDRSMYTMRNRTVPDSKGKMTLCDVVWLQKPIVPNFRHFVIQHWFVKNILIYKKKNKKQYVYKCVVASNAAVLIFLNNLHGSFRNYGWSRSRIILQNKDAVDYPDLRSKRAKKREKAWMS
jgi:hypothetical protein